jgi:hypothetical protein
LITLHPSFQPGEAYKVAAIVRHQDVKKITQDGCEGNTGNSLQTHNRKKIHLSLVKAHKGKNLNPPQLGEGPQRQELEPTSAW